MKKLQKFDALLMKAVELISVALLASIALMMAVQIVSRLFRIGLQWPEEMARFAFVGVTFCGSALALYRNKHIVVDMLLTKLGRTPRLVLEVLAQLCVAAFSSVAIYGILLTIESAKGVHANSLVWFEYNYLYWLVFVSLVLIVLQALFNACLLIAGRQNRKEVSE